jgi:hypothetical protein
MQQSPSTKASNASVNALSSLQKIVFASITKMAVTMQIAIRYLT